MESTGPPNKLKSASILIVDDDAHVRRWLRGILESAGYAVREAAGGKAAMDLLKGETVDLVITDLLMPGQDGIETIQQLRREHPELKILAVSGTFEEAILRAAELLGASAALQKPIQLDNLLQTVQRLLKT